MSINNCVHVAISIFVNKDHDASPAEIVAAIDKIIRREFNTRGFDRIPASDADPHADSWDRKTVGTVEDIRVREGL